MAWEWDTPTGTFRNHALSSKIREAAISDTQFAMVARPEPGYGKGRGDTVTWSRVGTLAATDPISETERLPSERPTIGTHSVTVAEWGRKIPMTGYEQKLAYFDLRNPFQRELRNQIRYTMDKAIATAMKRTPVKFVASGAGAGSFETVAVGAPASGTAAANLDTGHLRIIYDYMRGTLKAPPFKSGNYGCICSTRAARGIKSSSDFKDWISPTSSDEFGKGIKGFLRTIEGITIWETNHFDALSNAFGTAGVAGEALFFGEDAAILAMVQDPEIRVGLAEDLGRFQDVGWVGIFQAALAWQVASEARVVHFASAA